MKERPILFSAPMVRALLDGSKTQTRRAAKTEITMGRDSILAPHRGRKHAAAYLLPEHAADAVACCPYGQPGDRLWVREAHSIYPTHGQHRADGERWGPWGGLPTTVSEDGKQIAYYREGFDRCDPGRWRPSIHMPRWASRITLEITSVRVERLQDISEADALAEGVFQKAGATSIGDAVETATGGMLIYAAPTQAREEFRRLWEQINGPGSWDANPWVWVVEFHRLQP